MAKRTGRTQIEKTETGVITTAEEKFRTKDGRKRTQWVQIGYTSVEKNDNGKSFINGQFGKQLV